MIETAQGGFAFDTTGLTPGTVLPAGTPMTFDESTRTAKAAKADGTDVKGLLFTDVTVGQDDSLSVLIRGTVYERRIPAVSNEIKAALPLIVFSQSF